MRNIESRIHNLNGTWYIKSTIGKGTTVHFNIPVGNLFARGAKNNLSSDLQQIKVFGSWLSNIIPDLDKDRGRIDDDDTMMKIVRIARKGIPQKQYAVLKKELQFSKEDWMHILDSSESTLRRLDKKDFLDKRHSEKLADIAMLGDYGEEVFGSSEIFLDWLDTESPALDDIRPKELLDTSQGISIVKMELGRIDHGITL